MTEPFRTDLLRATLSVLAVALGFAFAYRFALVLLGLLIAVVVAINLSRRILVPLNSVTDSIRRVARGDLGAAVQYLQRLVALDPLRDSAQRALMLALAAGGEFAAATQVVSAAVPESSIAKERPRSTKAW